MTGMSKVWKAKNGDWLVAFREGGAFPGINFNVRLWRGLVPVALYLCISFPRLRARRLLIGELIKY